MYNRNTKSRRIAVCGIFSALSLTCMLMGSFFPFSDYLAPAISGIFILPVVIEYKLPSGILMYLAISLLSLFVTPRKEIVAVFIFFLGWYPFAKLYFDKLKFKTFLWLIKVVVFNLSLSLAYFFIIIIFPIGEVVSEFEGMSFLFISILIFFANITFIIYDRALTRLLCLYFNVWRKKIMDIK